MEKSAVVKGKFPRNVWALGWTSFFTDISTEIIYPLLPVFLTTTLGASTAFVGLVEGLAESTASLLKLASGWWADKTAKRKPLAVLGYSLSGLTRPIMAMAFAGWHVLLARFLDRIGKGIRTSPRDALLADSVPPGQHGAAFGIHRSMDNAGAVMGPLLAWAALTWVTRDYRTVFWIATVPMFFAVLALSLGASEKAHAAGREKKPAAPSFKLTGTFKRYLCVLFLFTLGNSSDAFLILRAKSLGVSEAHLPLLWAALNLVKTFSGLPAGFLSDRIRRKIMIIAGWMIYAVVYTGFGFAAAAWHVWVLFLGYGFFFGMTEAAERAMVADFYPGEQRGRAFGFYNGTIGFGALPASLLMGFLWSHFSVPAAFGVGASLAAVAAVLMALLV